MDEFLFVLLCYVAMLVPFLVRSGRDPTRWTSLIRRYAGYIVLLSVTICAGPMLVPRYLNTDPIIKVHAETPGDIVPISGWYGPGAWIAFVLTALSAVCRMLRFTWHTYRDHETRDDETCEECSQHRDWDADIIVSLIYISVSAIDLVRHSLRTLRASEPRMDDVSLVHAIQASVTAVYVGCGFAYILFILLIPLLMMLFYEVRFVWLYWRRLLPVIALLLVTYGAIFTFHGAQVILTSRVDTTRTDESLSRGTAYASFATVHSATDPMIRGVLSFEFNPWHTFDRVAGIPIYLLFLAFWSSTFAWTALLDIKLRWVRMFLIAQLLMIPVLAWFTLFIMPIIVWPLAFLVQVCTACTSISGLGLGT
jgi:hypothetical protein